MLLRYFQTTPPLEQNFFPKIIMAAKKNSRFSSALFPLVHATSYIIHIPKYHILKCEISPKIFRENKSMIITLLLVRLPPPPCYNMLCFNYPPPPRHPALPMSLLKQRPCPPQYPYACLIILTVYHFCYHVLLYAPFPLQRSRSCA